MADFKIAYDLLKKVEFSNNVDNALHIVGGDSGGLTYKGIASRYHHNWAGWEKINDVIYNSDIIDYKAISHKLEEDRVLQEQVKVFFKVNFWDRIWGSEIDNQTFANSMFLFAVNVSPQTAIRKIQSLLNVRIDGIMGTITVNAINRNREVLIDMFKEAQKTHYENIVKSNPEKAKFLDGWFNRIDNSIGA